jgi:formate C-acetyltransferase
MLEGLSAVGSDDAGINVALVFSEHMRAHLASCQSYEDFYRGLAASIREAVTTTLDRLNEYRRTRALYRPSVVRTLLVDDCLENQTEFNAGGARYVYSLINNAGVINVIDSLNVIRELVYDKKKYAPKDFIALMDARDPAFLADAETCPSYGNDNDAADAVGTALIADIAEAFSQRECYPRGRFYPVANQFKTFIHAGGRIPATPDGRAYGAPLCDSLGAIHGNDYKGPTALLNSVAKLGFHQFIGSPVTNMRISKKHLPTVLAPLVSVFFENGGMQLQITCASREEMLDAMVHPEAHKSLIVRVGGFSEYFIRLDPAMQKSIIERTEF